MVIVEGPDGAGKTTLCNRLAEDFPLEVMDWQVELGISRDDLKDNPTRRYYYALREEFVDENLLPDVIHDRFFFSSLVYGPLMQGNIQMAEEDRKIISRTILAIACPLIVCMPPKPVVVDNVRGEGHQLEGVAEIIEDVYDAYLALMRSEAYPFVMYYDYTDTMNRPNYHAYEELKIRVQNYMDRRARRTFR